MVFLDGLLVVPEADADFVPFALRLKVVLLEHLQVGLPLLLLSSSHLVNDLDHRVYEQHEEKDHHQDRHVCKHHRWRVARSKIPVTHRTDRLQTPIGRIVQPNVPRVLNYYIHVKTLTSDGVNPRGAGLASQPVINSLPRTEPVEVVVYAKKDGGQPEHDENDDELQPNEPIYCIPVGVEL